ncbi:MAG: DUF1517 domain-containing protein [Thermostichales cyanobacterium SZTDM-1c_bins_54]
MKTWNWQAWWRPLLTLLLVVVLVVAPAGDVWARSGGRMGGGSFRVPSAPRITRSLPSQGPTTYYYGGGYGGWGMPLLFPFFVGGGGGLLPLLFLLGAGAVVFRYVRSRPWSEDTETETAQVTEIQIALLASARTLQNHLEQLAQSVDTSSPTGLSHLLQEVSLSLLRHQDYWVYGAAQSRTLPLSQAEQFFYQRSLQERSNFTQETLTRVGSQPLRRHPEALTTNSNPGEYVVLTLLVASTAKLDTLSVVDAASLRQTLMQWGSLPADELLAVEVLWTPQVAGDVLTDADLLVTYPQLRRL